MNLVEYAETVNARMLKAGLVFQAAPRAQTPSERTRAFADAASAARKAAQRIGRLQSPRAVSQEHWSLVQAFAAIAETARAVVAAGASDDAAAIAAACDRFDASCGTLEAAKAALQEAVNRAAA